MEKIKNMRTIRAGSRKSRLALIQVKEVFALLSQKGVRPSYKSVTYKTKGDKDKSTPLTAKLPDDFFTDRIDKAVLKGEVDVAIHSAKDLPARLPKGLSLFTLTRPLDTTDALVSTGKFKTLKRGVRIGTSSTLRQEMIKKLFPQLKTKQIRGTIEERIQLVKQGKCEGIIVASAALKRLGLRRLIKDICPWEGFALQGQLAVVGKANNAKLKEIFSKIDVRKTYGKVTLVGAGPGDPDLITAKGINALRKADCVFYDFLVSKELLKYAKKAQKIYVGKRKGKHALPQAKLSQMLKEKAMKGKNIVRLKGGDPLIFGRGADEISYLKSYHIDVDIIPGISAATGIPSGMRIPLTARGISSSVAFISGHSEDEKAPALKPIKIPKADTLVFFMGLTKLALIVRSLKKMKWDKNTPAIVISKGTMAGEKIVSGTISSIERQVAKAKLKAPALIVVGQTVRFWDSK